MRLIRQQAEELGDSYDDDPVEHEDIDYDGFYSEDSPNIQWTAQVDSGEYFTVMAWNIQEAAEEAVSVAEVEYPDSYVVKVQEG